MYLSQYCSAPWFPNSTVSWLAEADHQDRRPDTEKTLQLGRSHHHFLPATTVTPEPGKLIKYFYMQLKYFCVHHTPPRVTRWLGTGAVKSIESRRQEETSTRGGGGVSLHLIGWRWRRWRLFPHLPSDTSGVRSHGAAWLDTSSNHGGGWLSNFGPDFHHLHHCSYIRYFVFCILISTIYLKP